MTIELPLFYSDRFFQGEENLFMHPVEFCESMNQKIGQLKLSAIIGIVRAVLAACAFCAAATIYSLGLSSLKGRMGSAAFGFLGLVLLMKVRSSYCLYVKRHQEIQEEIEQYPKHFQFKEKVLLEKIRSFISPVFQKYEISVEKMSEWKIQGGEAKRGLFTSILAEEMENIEMFDRYRSWAEFLSFVVDEEQIPEATKKELVREVLPLIDPDHFLSLSSLPSSQQYLEEHLKEGGLIFRRAGQTQEMIGHGRIVGELYEVRFSEPQCLKEFLVNKYQISTSLKVL